MSMRHQAVIRAGCIALVILLVGFILPIWDVWYVNKYFVGGYHGHQLSRMSVAGNLWSALAQIPSNVADADHISGYPSHSELQRFNLLQGLILFAVAGLVGLGNYWCLSRHRSRQAVVDSSLGH